MIRINFHKNTEEKCSLCSRKASEVVYIEIMEISDDQYFNPCESAVASTAIRFPLCTRHYNEWQEGKIEIEVSLVSSGVRKETSSAEVQEEKPRRKRGRPRKTTTT